LPGVGADAAEGLEVFANGTLYCQHTDYQVALLALCPTRRGGSGERPCEARNEGSPVRMSSQRCGPAASAAGPSYARAAIATRYQPRV